jgi:peptidoglycan hydrolase-like protein with peptidoglycan-binding domain
VDGIFGQKTQSWVRGFQQAEGFKADGIAGPLTWQALVTESLSG